MWEHCLKRLEAEIPKSEILLWIRPLEVAIENNRIVLLASNDVVMEKVQNLYLKLIVAAIREIFGQTYSAEIKIHKPSPIKSDQDNLQVNKSLIPSNLDARFVFDNFIEGRSNTIALAAATGVQTNSKLSGIPAYCWRRGLQRSVRRWQFH